jgi:hypothetical protein
MGDWCATAQPEIENQTCATKICNGLDRDGGRTEKAARLTIAPIDRGG